MWKFGDDACRPMAAEEFPMQLPEADPFIRIINEVLRVHGRIRPLFEQIERATGLSNMELAVLASIAEAREPLTVSRLGRSLGHPRQVIQRTANELVARGLIRTEENPLHRRAPVFSLTPKGRSLKDNADVIARTIGEQVRSNLDLATCDAAVAGLRAARIAIDRHLELGSSRSRSQSNSNADPRTRTNGEDV
jgi:DNA-binding MarR family transcriptional regulator